MGTEELYPAGRLSAARRATAAAGLDALLLTPGSDLRWLTGYDARESERLTCLVLPAEGEPTLVVPVLERPDAEAAPGAGFRIVDHADGDDPWPLVRAALPGPVRAVGIADRMWAQQVLALRAALPDATQRLASEVLRELRIRKSPAEVAALAEAGAAIDAVHRRMGQWLRPGRTEREVAADVAAAIRAAGHAAVDFVIVAAGPHGASPHHGTSDRPIGAGEPVVVDIGGTMPSGYRSDCTRTYVAGGPAPAGFADLYAVLREAQHAAVAAVRPGVTAEDLDAVARDMITAAGFGDAFLHRTGHGIGLDTHEDPYVVTGNPRPLEAGMAFSVEPGIYLAGRYGARIEDIVVCTTDGGQRLNTTPTELIAL
ncbi:Xaa-Pro peptidase family protein [Micromonospora sp. WMMA1998]|uniref:M24 family metallopeptidase n=1 Tax=Micromonospora sp. WMMA1998 TaxID=3015167 RepID=UPI00248C86BA|nr:Xaa-Pro peptidase family protein [Micromonospora sp. WMMA1998]WBC15922.1 Xaa-Pro peptidase family protein [Micromonospora sp. WMMA1998]